MHGRDDARDENFVRTFEKYVDNGAIERGNRAAQHWRSRQQTSPLADRETIVKPVHTARKGSRNLALFNAENVQTEHPTAFDTFGCAALAIDTRKHRRGLHRDRTRGAHGHAIAPARASCGHYIDPASEAGHGVNKNLQAYWGSVLHYCTAMVVPWLGRCERFALNTDHPLRAVPITLYAVASRRDCKQPACQTRCVGDLRTLVLPCKVFYILPETSQEIFIGLAVAALRLAQREVIDSLLSAALGL